MRDSVRAERKGVGPVVLAAAGIRKSYAGVQALRGASLEVRSGEVHALIGENGAGKSTLAKVITGAVQPDAGELWLCGKRVEANSPAVSRGLGIAAIAQHPALFPDLSVAENISLALEAGTTGWRVDWRQRRRRAAELLEVMGAEIDPRRVARSLSMAEQQTVEIAKAVGTEARVLLMDEPTALLGHREVDRLFGLMERLRGEGAGIVYVSHRLEEILAIADRVTVLRDGETVACREASGVGRVELIELMVGRSVASIFPKRVVPIGEVAMEVKGLTNHAAGVREVSFAVRAGEIFGMAGLVGSGRTETAQTIFGLTGEAAEVWMGGKLCRIRSPAEAIARGLAYLPEDRRQHGVVAEMDVAANVSMANLGAISPGGLIDREEEDGVARGFVDALRVKAGSVATAVGTLSGGNQQKVALARWLATGPKVMILDEPTQGVDVGSKAEIHELIMGLAEQGMAVVLISSELPEVLGMSDRVGVFRGGSLVGILDRAEATQARVMGMAFGDETEARA